jgi:hypothetical protein
MPRKRSDTGEDAALPPETADAGKETAAEAAGPADEPRAEPETSPAAPTEPDVPGAEPTDAPAPEPAPAAAFEPQVPMAEPTLADAPAPEPAAVSSEAAGPAVRDEVTEESHEEHHEEEAGPSLAGRALAFLLILIVGAALGIWAAPKLAPMLPSGLQPVADWLTPGRADAEAEIAALEERVNAGLGGLESRLADLPAASDVDARVDSAVGAAEDRLGAELAALKQSVGQADTAGLSQRLARLESALEGQAAELADIKEQFAGAAGTTGQISQEALERIDVYRSELEGLRAEMGTLQETVAGFSSRLDQAESQADREIAAAQTKLDELQQQSETRLGAAEIAADLALVRGAIAGGQPFEEPLSRLAGQPGVTVPPGLTAAAGSGVATLASLRDGYADAAHAAIRASILAGAGEGVLARSRAFLAAQVASRSLTPQAGAGTDAVLSRMEERLRHDDLDGLLAEAGQLPSEAAAAMQGWLDAVRLRAGAVHGLAELETALSATN